MVELTRYLSNIMNSVLLGLPIEIKDMIYFDALSHAASNILVSLPYTPQPGSITYSPKSLCRLARQWYQFRNLVYAYCHSTSHISPTSSPLCHYRALLTRQAILATLRKIRLSFGVQLMNYRKPLSS